MVLGDAALVRSLVTESGRWNSQLIRESFLANEVDAILSLTLSATTMDNSLIWHFEKFGLYYVRSGYNLGCVLRSWDIPATYGVAKWWKSFWNLRIP